MAITDIFTRYKKQIDTTEQHQDTQLRTHYYQHNFNHLFQIVEGIIRCDADCQIKTISKEWGGIWAEMKNPFPCFLEAKIKTEKSFETTVDFKISAEKQTLTGINKDLRKRILSLYERIDNKFANARVVKNS